MYNVKFNDTLKKSVVLTLFTIFLLSCIFLLMVGSSFHIAEPPSEYLGVDNSADTLYARLQFLEKLGFSPDPDSEESERVTIPPVFSDVYENYNDIQKQSGGDLSLYKNAPCQRFTYIDKNSGERLNILVYKNRVIGGDRCTVALDGDMFPL